MTMKVLANTKLTTMTMTRTKVPLSSPWLLHQLTRCHRKHCVLCNSWKRRRPAAPRCIARREFNRAECTETLATTAACAHINPTPSADRSLGASNCQRHVAARAKLLRQPAAPCAVARTTPGPTAGTSAARHADDNPGDFPCHAEHRSNADSCRAPTDAFLSCFSRTWTIALSRPQSRPGCGASVAGCTICAYRITELNATRPAQSEPASTVRAQTLLGDATQRHQPWWRRCRLATISYGDR